MKRGGILTPFFALVGFLAPMVDLRGSACAWAWVGDILRAWSTLGPCPGSSDSAAADAALLLARLPLLIGLGPDTAFSELKHILGVVSVVSARGES